MSRVCAVLACACLMLLCAFGCAPETLAPVAPEESLSIRPSDEGVADFLALLGDAAPASYENDTCYDITPDFVRDNSDCRIFKFSVSCASFALYDGKAYALGESLGGSGADSFALADMDGDGACELYFAFSWGSGMHRSMAGCFDPAARAVTVFDAAFYGEDCMLTLSTDGGLAVRRAEFTSRESFVSYDIAAGETLGTLVYEDNAVQFREAAQNPA